MDQPDPTFHQPVRLKIMAALRALPVASYWSSRGCGRSTFVHDVRVPRALEGHRGTMQESASGNRL